MSDGLKTANVPQSWLTLGCFDDSRTRRMTFVAFVPCLMHDLRSTADFNGRRGAFGGAGVVAGGAGAVAAALA